LIWLRLSLTVGAQSGWPDRRARDEA